MPVTAQTPVVTYTANGSTTVFPYTFRLLISGDLDVYFNNVLQSSGFSVSGVGNPTGGNVTFTVAPTNGTQVMLRRSIDQTRTTDYVDGGPLLAAVLDDDLDRLVMMVQDTKAVQLDHGEAAGLADDDHPQYHNNARGDARYPLLGHTHTASNVTDFTSSVDARIGAASINALADVVIKTPASGEVIKWNGTNWVNAADQTAGGSITTVADLVVTGTASVAGNTQLSNLLVTGTTTLNGGLTLSGALGGITNLTTTGNTVLGNAVGDTLNVANGSLQVDASGFIGLGGAPSSRLHVYAQEGLRISNDTGFVGYYNGANTVRSGYLQINTSGATFNVELNQPMDFRTNNVVRLAISAAGAVTLGGVGAADLALVSPAATSTILRSSVGGTEYGYFGTAGATNALVTGSVLGDMYLRTANKAMLFSTNNGSSATLSISSGGVTSYNDGIISAEIGWRSLPPSTPADASTLIVGMRGRMVVGGFTSLTVPSGVFARGDLVTIYNDGTATMTLTQGSGLTLRLGGTATTGNRSIAGRGVCTILFNSASEAIATGAGVS
jgi:hypothetical protein